MTPIKRRRHVRTGRPTGPPPGSQNALKDGLKTTAFFARRKEVNAIIREARQAIRAAK
jgi:hypothetical protein